MCAFPPLSLLRRKVGWSPVREEWIGCVSQLDMGSLAAFGEGSRAHRRSRSEDDQPVPMCGFIPPGMSWPRPQGSSVGTILVILGEETGGCGGSALPDPDD